MHIFGLKYKIEKLIIKIIKLIKLLVINSFIDQFSSRINSKSP